MKCSTPAERAAVKLSNDQEKAILGLLATTAVQKMEEGRKEEMTFADACRFWGLPETASGEAVDHALKRLPATLDAVENLLIGETIELSNGQSVSQEDLKSLAAVHKFLASDFRSACETLCPFDSSIESPINSCSTAASVAGTLASVWSTASPWALSAIPQNLQASR